ncbi:MAG: hypothetical protein ACO2Z7_06510 [Burkholderiaceae bacterium]
MKYKTEMTFPVELTFEVLPPMLVEDVELPAQLDITKVLLTIVGPSGKPRQVDITNTLTEEQTMLFEDEIAENYSENPTL